MASFTVPTDFYCPITGDLLKDPVVDPEGHSYEKDAIMKWLETKKVSPMTRNPLFPFDLKPNIALKNGIETIKDKLSQEQLKINSRVFEEKNQEFVECLKEIKPQISINDNNMFVTIGMPDPENRPPVDVCLTIDVSGSMGTEATLKGDKGETLSYGYSVLSVTVCAAKTIMNCLNENDNISIVTYTDKSSIIVDYWSVTKENKVLIDKMLDELKPLNTTNIWDGVKTSLDILKAKSPKNRMKGIFLLTDGVPNVEPSRGHEYVLEKYYKDNSDFNCMINSYGFGYQLKSDLLQNISSISGGDGFAFIPDSSLLGNIFIHGMGNFLTTAAFGSVMKINLKDGFTFEDNSTEKSIKIDSLKYGQDKHFVIPYKIIPGKDTDDIGEMNLIINDVTFTSSITNGFMDNEQIARIKAVETLDALLNQMKFNEKDVVKTIVTSYLEYLNSLTKTEFIENIIFDFSGQVKEALNMTNEGEKQDWFSKWGRHYLRSLMDAYKNEVCNNFKDKGVTNFGGQLFDKLRDKISDIFDNMPPPKKTIQSYTYGSSGMRGGGAPALAPIATMASYNTNFSGGCCARGSMIKMADNSQKPVEELRYGEKVMTVDIDNGFIKETESTIECVIITKCDNSKEYMVQLEGGSGNRLHITPYHPVYSSSLISNKWRFPIDISSSIPVEIDCKDMFTFVVKNRKPVIVEDFIFATYGHQMKGEVIEHAYFGTEKIIDDLKQFDTYRYGYVHLKKNMFVKENGKVTHIINYQNISFKTNITELLMYANL